MQKKEELKKEDAAIVRLEQLYPMPLNHLKRVLARYQRARMAEWVREEPAKLGPLNFVMQHLADIPMTYVARPQSGSSATGSLQLNKIQQKLLGEKKRCQARFTPILWHGFRISSIRFRKLG